MLIANCTFNKMQILCEAMIGLEKSFWMIYSNTHLRTRETLPLKWTRHRFRWVHHPSADARDQERCSLSQNEYTACTTGLSSTQNKNSSSSYWHGEQAKQIAGISEPSVRNWSKEDTWQTERDHQRQSRIITDWTNGERPEYIGPLLRISIAKGSPPAPPLPPPLPIPTHYTQVAAHNLSGTCKHTPPE